MEISKNQETAEQQNDKKKTFIKRHKKALFIGVFAFIVIVLACILADPINNAMLNRYAQSYLDGKIFIVKYDDSVIVYTFSKNTINKERWYTSDKSSIGDKIETSEYKVEGSLGSKTVRLWYIEYGKWRNSYIDFRIYEDGSVECCSSDWKLSTVEEINTIRNEMLCDHKFGPDTIINVATCTSDGEISHTCKKCGYLETQNIDALGHSYVNNICSECGAKKQPQKSYDIEANTWYTYQDVLHFQNIKLLSAFSVMQGKGMSVSYNFVCQHCHIIDEIRRTNVPEFNYVISKVFTCQECGGLTTVKIELG